MKALPAIIILNKAPQRKANMRSAGTAWVLSPKKGISTFPFTDWDLLGLASDSGQVEAG